MTPSCRTADLQPFYKEKQVFINPEFHQRAIEIFLKVADYDLFKNEKFILDLKKFLSPGINPSDDIKLQIKTISKLYSKLSNSFKFRDKYLNPEIENLIKPCQLSIQIFPDETAAYLIQEMSILSKDLYSPSTDISDTSKSQRTSSILMQVILNLNEIISLVINEATELENYANFQPTENIYLNIQNSSCIEPNLMEHVKITENIPTKTGVRVSLTIIQFKQSMNTFSIIPTSYLGKEVDFTNTYLINEKLFKCQCLFSDKQILTGCECVPFDEKCSKALINNNLIEIFNNCPFTQTKVSIPRITYTGILFPYYTPFTISQSTTINKIPQQPTNLPFHITTANALTTSFNQHELTLQSNHHTESESIDILNLNEEERESLENFMMPISWENILTYVSWAMGGTLGILIIPIIICASIKIKHYKTENKQHNQRKTVTLKLSPFLFTLF